MEPEREGSGSDCVGPGRLGGISSPFRVHGKEGLLPVPMNVGWCIKIRNTNVQNAIRLMFNVSRYS